VKIERLKEAGAICMDYTIYCSECTNWDFLDGNNKKEAMECAIEEGWMRHMETKKWTCPECLAVQKEKDDEGINELLTELYDFVCFTKEKSKDKIIKQEAKKILEMFLVEGESANV
jgi:hypothetical protein